MYTKLFMTISAVVMCIFGVILSFLPLEVLVYFSSANIAFGHTLLLQILGALYFSFGMINWTARANLIGGIYGRPIAIGNFTHFTIGALALVKGYFSSHDALILLPATVYTMFAIIFGLIFFTHPVRESVK